MNKVLGGGSMKRRVGFVGKCLVGVALAGVASGGALAQTATNASDGTNAFAADLPVKAPAAEPVSYWWFSGSVEAGYRDFLNSPQNGHTVSTAPAGTPGVAGDSLAKYYEYSDIRPGAFGNFWLSTGTKDGLYRVDVGGKNVGYDDQQYWLNASKAGQFYFNFMWDQTPHVYSTSANSIYGVSGNALIANPCSIGKTTAATLAPCATPTDIGIRRDTAAADARWTPDDAWDIRAEYSHMSRTGTQVGSVFSGTATTTQIQKPVDDTTQNYGLNGEYAGTSPWGQRMVFKLGYSGSTFTENLGGDSFTIQSTNNTYGARESVWPSNRADGFSGSAALDLPWKSRYVGNVSYTMMRQDDSFMPNNTLNPQVLPASSLNGAINTLLINNQLTTKITPDLTSKLTYRYYDFQNDTPEIAFLNAFIGRDGTTTTQSADSLSMAYTKQNAGADLNWRPSKEWNLGVAYGFERYDWTRADVDVTNENSAKVYGDWKPFTWFTLRASGSAGFRRYDNYDYQDYVGFFQWMCPNPPDAACTASNMYSTTYRQLMLDNRDLYNANISADLAIIHNLTLTPLVKYVEAEYQVDPGQQGLTNSRKWSAGADLTYVPNPDTSFMVGYMYEWGSQLLFGVNCTGENANGTNCTPPATAPYTMTNDTSTVHTFTGAVRYAVIPQKLDTELRYTASRGTDSMQLYIGSAPPAGGQFPDNHTWFQRLDAVATYTFDKDQLAQMGWKGGLKAKLHYAWERNAEDNWANDPLTPYTNLTGMTSTLWLGWDNPNYNVHMLMGSLIASW